MTTDITSTVPTESVPTPGGSATAAPTDELVRGIWSELLGIDVSYINDDVPFLRLGGDSVLSVRMASLLRRRTGVRLGLSDVGVASTVDDLVALLGRRAGRGDGRLPVELVRSPDPEAPFPLLPLQQGYFVGQQDGWELSYRSAHFHGDVGLTGVDADEAPDALEDALHRLAEHHPMIRARMTPEGTQQVLPLTQDGAVPVPTIVDLRGLPEPQVRERLAGIRDEMSRIGPDPQSGPGLDVRLSLLDGGDARLHTSMSLLVFDGWSATLLNRDLLTLAADWNTVLAPLEVEFGDYVGSVESLPRTQEYAADRDWWFERIDDFPPPPALPLRADPRSVRPETMRTWEVRLSAQQLAQFRARCAAHDVTPSTALYTAFAVVMARWSGHRHLLLGSLQLNRLPLHPDLHRVIGAFASTLLLPAELAEGDSMTELASLAQQRFSEFSGHSLITGVEVSRELGRRRDTRRPIAPVVFQSTLGMDSAVGGEHLADAGPLGRISFADFYHQLRTPQVALEVRCYEMHGELALVFSAVEELFDADAVGAAFDEMVALATSLTTDEGWDAVPDLPAAALPQPGDNDVRARVLSHREPAVDRVGGPPSGEVEQRIADLWEELLQTPVLDRSDTFFALGGDSLGAIRMLGRLRRELGESPAVRDFLADPTIAGIVGALGTGAAVGAPW